MYLTGGSQSMNTSCVLFIHKVKAPPPKKKENCPATRYAGLRGSGDTAPTHSLPRQ
jgi:hypothetical protein